MIHGVKVASTESELAKVKYATMHSVRTTPGERKKRWKTGPGAGWRRVWKAYKVDIHRNKPV